MCYNDGDEVMILKKKILLLAMILAVCLGIAGCSSDKPSADPLVAKWVAKYNDGASQVLFSFESIGDLDVVIWHYDEEAGELKQAEDHAGSYSVNKEAGTITYTTGEESFTFQYVLTEKTSLVLTFYDGTELTLNYVESNNAQ